MIQSFDSYMIFRQGKSDYFSLRIWKTYTKNNFDFFSKNNIYSKFFLLFIFGRKMRLEYSETYVQFLFILMLDMLTDMRGCDLYSEFSWRLGWGFWIRFSRFIQKYRKKYHDKFEKILKKWKNIAKYLRIAVTSN